MDDEERAYRGAVDAFYEFYYYLKKKYDLRLSIKNAMYEESFVEVHRYVGDLKVQILKVSTDSSTRCLEMALDRLKQYDLKNGGMRNVAAVPREEVAG